MGEPGAAHLPVLTMLAMLSTSSAIAASTSAAAVAAGGAISATRTAGTAAAGAAGEGVTVCRGDVKGTVYNHQFLKLHQRSNVTMNVYQGKVLLVVNVATYCNYTPQYLEMNVPVRHLAPHFDIVGFPCNQFGLQEPGLNHEILNGLRYVRPGGGFVPEFTMAAKVDVNGPNEHLMYTFMKDACSPAPGFTNSRSHLHRRYNNVKDVTWNFEKFLIDSKGKPRFRFSPIVSIPEVLPFVRTLMKEADVERWAVGDKGGKEIQGEGRGAVGGKVGKGTEGEERGAVGGEAWTAAVGKERGKAMVNAERGEEGVREGAKGRGRERGKERVEVAGDRWAEGGEDMEREDEDRGTEWAKLNLLLKIQHIMKESLKHLFQNKRLFIASRSAGDF